MTEPARALKPHWFHILVALAEGDLHGLAIVRAVLEQTDGGLRLWPVMLQTALEQMTEEGLIQPLDAPPEGESERRRYYRVTRAGRKAAAAEADRLERLAQHARAKLASRAGLASSGGGSRS